MRELTGPAPIGAINQVAMVVRDLDAAVRAYWSTMGIGPWTICTYGAPRVKDMTYRGRRQDFRMRLALAWWGDIQMELIQSLDGPNIYEEFLTRHGEGIHHLGVFVADIDTAIREMQQRGYAVIQSGRGYGRAGDGAFAYLETEAQLSTVVELIERTREGVEPDSIFPEGQVT